MNVNNWTVTVIISKLTSIEARKLFYPHCAWFTVCFVIDINNAMCLMFNKLSILALLIQFVWFHFFCGELRNAFHLLSFRCYWLLSHVVDWCTCSFIAKSSNMIKILCRRIAYGFVTIYVPSFSLICCTIYFRDFFRWFLQPNWVAQPRQYAEFANRKGREFNFWS